MSQEPLTIALVGNPNSGKTTLFNALTGRNEHVGNYPGVTVEEKYGQADSGGQRIRIADLPGTYSMTAYTQEEIITRNFLLDHKADVVIHVIDCSNLERSLYLTTQLLLIGLPVVLAFNMFDRAEAHGWRIDIAKLSNLLGVPIVPTVASKGKGQDELLAKAVAAANDPAAALARQAIPRYGDDLEQEIEKLAALAGRLNLPGVGHPRWLAIKLLESDAETIGRLQAEADGQALAQVMKSADDARKRVAAMYRDSAEIVLADRRYGFVSGACQEAVKHTVESRHVLSDYIDSVATNRYLGLPIFAFMMYLVFQVTFWLGNPVADLLDKGKEMLAMWVRTLGPEGSIWISLLADGVIEGVGAVLVFVPLIALLFLAIALLESTGYMARAAFVVDNLMHRVGLHGKSFIPMLIGFGCTVPAIMATRTLESRRDRLATMLVLPLISCGARLPVYALILAAFFPRRVVLNLLGLSMTNQALLLFLIYLIGVAMALLAVRLLRKTLFAGEAGSFVMELPPYRLPTVRALLRHIWVPTWMFVQKAGTVILAAVVIMWTLKTWPQLPPDQTRQFEAQRAQIHSENLPADELSQRLQEVNIQEHHDQLLHSAIGRVGSFIAPVLKPCGFDWKISTALMGALAAKEMFIGQMGVIYAVHERPGQQAVSLRQALVHDYTQLQGFCIMLFILIASPCMATLAATWRESGSIKWPAFQWSYLTILAWLVTTAVFQVGRLLGG